ncbi:MAG: DUF3298 domain-containing protein [Bacteroidales bacterium]|nr:DUF3298 domain-containing protein [Bacteroidales bacterium]
MKKRFPILPLAATLLLALATDCVRGPRMDILQYSSEQETASEAGCPLTHRLDISLEYPVIKGDKELSATIIRQSIFEAAFGQGYDTLNVDEAASRYAGDLAAEFRELSAAMWRGWRRAGIDPPEAMEWSDVIEGYFAGQNGPYRSYIVNITDFTGGAHSNSVTHAFVFDTRDGSRLTLDDLFVPDFDAPLTEIIARHIPESLSEEDIEALFDPAVQPTGNYILTSDSITFIYNPYEIGPWSIGTPSISVPLKECRKAGILAKKIRTR